MAMEDRTKMQVVGAVIHKLIRVIYSVLKSGQPFDLAKLMPAGVAKSDSEKTSNLAPLRLSPQHSVYGDERSH